MRCVDDCKYREMLDDANADLQELKAENESLKDRNVKLRKLVADMLNAWDDVQRETVTGPTFDECEARACKMGIEL